MKILMRELMMNSMRKIKMTQDIINRMLGKNNAQENKNNNNHNTLEVLRTSVSPRTCPLRNNTKFTDMKLSTLFGKNPVSSFIGKVTKKPVDNLLGKDSQYDERELAQGIKVEQEHTNNPLEAARIAKEHLREIPDYYTRLAKMYREAKR